MGTNNAVIIIISIFTSIPGRLIHFVPGVITIRGFLEKIIKKSFISFIWFLHGMYLEKCSDNTDCIWIYVQIMWLVCRYMFAFYWWNFWWRTLYMAFIHFILGQYVVVWIVFIKLTDLVLLCMAPQCVDFAGFFRGSIPPLSFFSFDFLWSLCFSFLYVPFLLLFTSLLFFFSSSPPPVHQLLCPSLTVEEKNGKNVLYTLRYDLNFNKCDNSLVKLNLCV